VLIVVFFLGTNMVAMEGAPDPRLWPSILVVMDMQEGFSTCTRDQDVLREVENLVYEFSSSKKRIIFVKYEGPKCGELIPSVKEMAENSTLSFFIKKKDDDGSLEILLLLEQEGVLLDRIDKCHICGINTAYCIKDTVRHRA
jgi:nicotinamidase-related amidase